MCQFSPLSTRARHLSHYYKHFRRATNSTPPSLHYGLTYGLTGRFATEADLWRNIGKRCVPNRVFARGLTTRLALACFPREQVLASGSGTQYNLVSWALNSFGVPLDDFRPGRALGWP